jgi:CSLREA domain-containing protein
LDILPGGGITLTGAGLGQTVIDASGLGDRVFHVLAGAELNVLGLTVTGGQVAGDGGGLFNAGQVQLEYVAVTNNTANYGGGIRNFGQLTILDSTISGNTISQTGGGISNVGGEVTILRSTVSGNTADHGGGLWSNSIATVIDSTFSGNSALLSGGGVFNSGTLTLDSSTLFGNRADAAGSNAGTGGGIRSNPAGTITVHNTIVAGNVRGTGSMPDDISGSIQGISSFNLIGDATTAGGLTDGTNGNMVGDGGAGTIVAASILDTTLADNGGPTFTHALVAGSPAIDAGDPAFQPGEHDPPRTTDQRGQDRVVDGLANEVPRIDVGAYELQQPFLLSQIVVTTFADIINPNDGMISLREAVLLANQSDNDVTILLPAGSYLLSLQGRDEDASWIGDLDIAAGSTVTILGAGSAQTVIDAHGLGDRILDVLGGAVVNLEGLTITRGHMPNNGGGIRNAGTLELHDVVVTDNSGYNGGGIRNTGQLTISASVISENTGSNTGGGISNFGGQLTVSGSTLSHNSAPFGGGLWTDAEATVVDSTFLDNFAHTNGGAIVQATGGTLVLTRSTLSGNEGNFGGGLLNSGTSFVVNSTFSGNQARTGGGGISSSGTLSVSHSTFVGNRADANENGTGSGGGIRRGGGTISLHGTILAGNVRGAARIADDIAGTLESVSSFNLISDASSSGGLAHGVNGNIVGNGGAGAIDAATILHTTLTDNGGPTMTHALVFGSPAIDAGDPDFDPGAFAPPLTTDQRGLPRLVDSRDDGTARIDIGAYEVQGPLDLPWIQVTTFDDVIHPDDGLISLREAVIRANSLEIDVTILLSAGTYTLSIQGIDDDQALTGDLDVLAGGSVTIVGARTAPTVIDATGLGDRVFHVLPGASLQLDGVTITGGTIPASGEQRLGGGILNEGQLGLTDSVLQGNAAPGPEAVYQGGGLANLASAVATVTGSTIAGNQAGMGGGVLNLGTMTITDSQISGNTAVSLGGGIYQFGTDAWLSIENSSITDNAGASGGGIAAFGGQLTVVASQLRENVATDPTSGGGGGVYLAQAATGRISTSTIAGNEALLGAGILLFGSLQVADSTISGNAAGLFAGGIGSGGTLSVLNSTVSANSSAQGGGGIAIDGGNAQVQHSTLFGNRADSDGSGIGTGGGILVNSGSMTLGHTIVAGNLRGSGEAVADDIASIVDTSSGYNLIGDVDSAGGLAHGVGGNIVGVDWTTVLDPDLKDNGGTTLTHALIPGSPAIDAGNPDFDPAAFDPPLLADQRGLPRVMSSLGTVRVDIGAVEIAEQIVVTTFDDVIDPDDGWMSLREAIRLANQLTSDVTIHLPPGTYHLTIQGANEDEALTGDLDILPGGSITIIGAASGQTVIDASALNDRGLHVFSGADLRIEGVTITGGAAPESGTNLQRSGGAILNSGTLALTHSTLDGNSAYRGGGLANSGGIAAITHSVISNNTGVTFRPSGGGIYNDNGGMVSVSDSTIADNTAFTGAGILNDSGSTLTAVRISVTGNSATGSSAAIVNSGTLTVAASTISGNTSSGISNDGTLVVSNSTIANNSALAMGQIGGGIRTRSAVTTIINSTISGNSAHGDGGGIYAVGGNLTLVNSTVVGNRANSDSTGSFAAGGIYVSLGSMTLQNTIVAGNRQGAVSSDQPSDIMAYDSELAGTFSLIGGADTAGGLIHGQNGNIVGVDWATVLDMDLTDNGGSTLTHALIPGSPAIDAGDPSFDPDAFDPPLAYDQRGEGFPRVHGGGVDIGAFEFPSPQVETTTIVASNANPSIYGDAIFFTATVSAATGTPIGTVQFIVGGNNLGTPVPLVNGVAQSPTISARNAGTHTVTAEYVAEPDAAFDSSSGQLPGGQMVNPKGLTVTADARSKIYGTADPALTYQITASALVGDDQLSGALIRAAGENVGTYAIGQGTLTAGGNYDLTFVGASLTITQAALTVTGITAADKVYDGTTEATLNVSGSALVGLIGSDVVMLDTSGIDGQFEDENVGQDKMVFISGLIISGADAGNYALIQPTTTASILPIPLSFIVTSLTPASNGFRVQFSQDLDASVLNLYDQGEMFGPADLTLIGAVVGEVRGSLVIGPTLREATFIRTEGLLAADDYTVTLKSSATAFRDTGGNLLDGDADGTPGGDYVTEFTVVAPPVVAVAVSLPNFTRGYGQPVNLPADNLTAGLPLSVSNGQGVGRIELEVRYDPGLLTITAFTFAETVVLPDAQFDLDTSVEGLARLTITAPSGLADAAGALIVGSFTAHVPHDAPYGGNHVLDIAALRVFDTAQTPGELPPLDVDAIHIAAFFGDANGDGSYNSPDATLTRRIIGHLNTGLGAYPLADPRLIVDIDGNGAIQSNDTTSIRRAIGLIPVPNIPALPEELVMSAASGPDPRAYVPQDLAGAAGQTVTVPVMLAAVDAGGTGVSSADLQELDLAPRPTNAADDAADGMLTVEAQRWLPDRFFRDLGTQWQALDELLSDLVDQLV